MREKYFVLINEEVSKVTYALCVLRDTISGPISRIERTDTAALDNIVDIALSWVRDLDAAVVCDVAYGGRLHGVAYNYGWQISKIKNRNEFPYVEFICGLRNIVEVRP